MRATSASYYDNSGRGDILAGGIRLIPITTPQGEFRVWTRRVGNNPEVKVLLLHGGPGATHEYFAACDSSTKRGICQRSGSSGCSLQAEPS